MFCHCNQQRLGHWETSQDPSRRMRSLQVLVRARVAAMMASDVWALVPGEQRTWSKYPGVYWPW